MIAAVILSCTIVAIPDGDGLHARCPEPLAPIAAVCLRQLAGPARAKCASRHPALDLRIRKADAPEIAHPGLHIPLQPYGPEAQANLAALCYGKPATVQIVGRSFDRYVANVACDGVDVATAQISAGFAWAWHPAKHSPLRAVEAQARAAGLGLWGAAVPAVPPWDWRKAGKMAK